MSNRGRKENPNSTLNNTDRSQGSDSGTHKKRVRQIVLYPKSTSPCRDGLGGSGRNLTQTDFGATTNRQSSVQSAYILPNRPKSPLQMEDQGGEYGAAQSAGFIVDSGSFGSGNTYNPSAASASGNGISNANNNTDLARTNGESGSVRLPPVVSSNNLSGGIGDGAGDSTGLLRGSSSLQKGSGGSPSVGNKGRNGANFREPNSDVCTVAEGAEKSSAGRGDCTAAPLKLLNEMNEKLDKIQDDIKKMRVDVKHQGQPHSSPRPGAGVGIPSTNPRLGGMDPRPPEGSSSNPSRRHIKESPRTSAQNSARCQQLTAETMEKTAESLLGSNALLDSPSSSGGSSCSRSSSESNPRDRKAAAEQLKSAKQKELEERAKKPLLSSLLSPPKRFSLTQTTPQRAVLVLESDRKPSSADGDRKGGARRRNPVTNFKGEVAQDDSELVVEVGRRHHADVGGALPGPSFVGGRPSGSAGSGSSHNNIGFTRSPIADVDHARAVDGLDRSTRRRSVAAKNLRENFFAPIPLLTEVADCSRLADRQYMDSIMLTSAPCSWLCCIAMALTYVTGVPTPIEKVLRANHLAIHYISLSSITLAEMFDLVQDYIRNCFHSNEDRKEYQQYLSEDDMEKLQHVHVEMATFDSELVDIDEGEEESTGMGEHAPISDPVKFRKELLKHVNDERSLYIFNYDPYVVEEEEIRLKCNLAETDEEQEKIRATARYTKANKGNFGILLNFNPVQHTLTILTPHFTIHQHPMQFPEDSEDEKSPLSNVSVGGQDRRTWYPQVFMNMVLEEHTISLQALYRAVHQRDPYSKLHRGFVRVFMNMKVTPSIPPLFPLFVLDGSSSGGLLSVLDVNIAPHILGLAMTHHLAIAFLLSDNARRKQSSRKLLNKANVCDVTLRGIPVTKLIQQLRLPLSMTVCESTQESITMAYAWYTTFLTQLQINHDVRLGLVLPSRRGGTEDGSPNVSEEDFLAHLQLCMETKSIMLLSFDPNAALNVKISDRQHPTHFAIVIGIDVERGVMRVADVNVKRFRKTWHLPISRMYNAVMGYGYMVAAKDKSTIKALNGKEFQEQALSLGKYHLPPMTKVVKRFEYPSRPYPITVLADAVERLGFSCDAELMMNFSGFHISFFLSRHMPLEGAAMVLQNFSHYALDDALSVQSHSYIYWSGNPPSAEKDPHNPVNPLHRILTEEDLIKEITFALEKPESRMLIMKIDQDVIMTDPNVWNGSDGSSYVLLVEYDARRQVVVLSNADVSTYYRTFACPISLLFVSLCSWDAEGQSGRGTILLDRSCSQESLYENTRGYDLAHSLVHHPFKPIFSSACACLALAATEMMHVVAPQFLDQPLTPLDEEKKKYKRYNNIFSAEDVLYSLPNFSVHDWKKVSSKDLYHTACIAFRALHLPLEAVDLSEQHPDLFTNPETFLQCCDGQSGVLTIILVAYDTDKTHGIPGSSVGIVNRVEMLSIAEGGGMIQLVNGDPCRWKAYLECPAKQLMEAATTVICVQEIEGEE